MNIAGMGFAEDMSTGTANLAFLALAAVVVWGRFGTHAFTS